MVRLDRIYTRGGDAGMTSLGDGTRVRKTHPRIAAYGAVDELNTTIGIAVLQRGIPSATARFLRTIQNDLFDLGADLCVPWSVDEAPGRRLRIVQAQVDRLERAIDATTARLKPLQSFILPGGTPGAVWLHAARVVCRRAELLAVAALDAEPQSLAPLPVVYLNRLSDLLFVLARAANRGGRGDVLWRPGAGVAAAAAAAESAAAVPQRRKVASRPRTVPQRRKAPRPSSKD